MSQLLKPLTILLSIAVLALPAEKKLKVENLPQAVQATIKEQTKDATLVGVSSEKEKGKTVYEVETKVGTKTRDFIVDGAGSVLETEEEVDFAAVPKAAQDAIQKGTGGGQVTKVEKLTRGSQIYYEAAITTKSGKKLEATVTPEGAPHK